MGFVKKNVTLCSKKLLRRDAQFNLCLKNGPIKSHIDYLEDVNVFTTNEELFQVTPGFYYTNFSNEAIHAGLGNFLKSEHFVK